MRILFECLFDIGYLITIFCCSWLTITKGNGQAGGLLPGLMGLVLGSGDGFHLIPRMKGLITGKINQIWLGLGKLITSITSVLYYLLLFYGWQQLTGFICHPAITILIWLLVISRISLLFLPQNHWFDGSEEGSIRVIRNIPFLLLGILLIAVLVQSKSLAAYGNLRLLPIAIFLSFAFYIPVVLFSEKYPAVGMLMMPKTLMYLWIQILFLQIL